MQNNLNKKNASGLALLPFLVFIAIYLGAGLIFQAKGVDMAFYQFPSVTAMFVALVVAFVMSKGSLNERFSTYAKGVADENVTTMLIIFLLAGAFSAVAAAMGGRDATVNLGLSVVPVQFLAAGIFIISAFMSTATGTSMGTVGAIIPIVIGVADKSGLSLPLVMGACVGGSMFGDNLSMISDTTIAATRTQGTSMKDKFKMNFFIALPAAIVTIVLLLVLSHPTGTAAMEDLSFNVVKILPYIAVLGLALVGINVFLVLTIGIALAGVIGLMYGDLTIATLAQTIYDGFVGMNEVFFLTLFVAGMSEMVKQNGGIEWLISKLSQMMKGQKSAQVGISALAALTDCATANNTVSIVITGNIAKNMSREYKVDPRRTSSLLDIFSCAMQGIIPYGAQLLVACSLANECLGGAGISPINVVGFCWYNWLLAIAAIISIFVPYADKMIKNNPWNWEYDCPESEVEEKKLLHANVEA